MDRAIAALATRQHGVVSRAQLRALGLGRGAIAGRLKCGRLQPLHRGVYSVGHRAVAREGRWLAAVLAVGDGAALSHRSAAALWALRPTARRRAEVTVSRAVRSRSLLEVHVLDLPADEVTVREGIPVTTVPRTLVDLAGLVTRGHLRRAVEQAEALRLADAISLDAVVRRHLGRDGVGRLAAIVEDAAIGATVTRSELERRFLAFLDEAGLPRPRVNATLRVGVATFEADCVWTDARVVVELDGAAHHHTRAAFERDRERDRALSAAGWRVVRVTWRQLHADPAGLARDLRALLG